MSRCERALAAVICFGFGSCVLPEATEIDGTNDASAGSSGLGGASGTGGGGAGGNGATDASAGTAGASGGSAGASGGSAGASGGSAGAGGAGGTAGSGGSAGASGGGAGSSGSSGAGGQGGGPECPVSGGVWPDSTPHCSDNTPLPCPEATEDGSIAGTMANYSGTGTLVDDVTGLEWEQNASQPGVKWADANTYCTNLGGGFRLPTLLELSSLVDYGRVPAWPAPFSQEQSFFWTSSVHPTGNHWGINFSSGLVGGYGDNAPGNLNVRCVRGATLATNPVPVGNAVCDSSTGLEWKAMADGPADWLGALAICEGLGPAWRLPSAKELLTIYVPDLPNHLPSAFAAGEPSGLYWSSTPVRNDPNEAWSVHFAATLMATPGVGPLNRSSALRVRCVRD
jgi:hypothetical protein